MGDPPFMQSSHLVDDYAGVCLQMKAMFEDPVKVQTVNRHLRELKQGCHLVIEYISDLQLISQDLRWNERALMDQIQESLSSEILDELASCMPYCTCACA